MSKDILKKYAMIVEGKQLNESSDFRGTMNLLDELQEALENAVQIARMLERDEVLGGVVRSYTRPWLQAWISDSNQMGSVDSMRESLAQREEDSRYMDDEDDNAEGDRKDGPFNPDARISH